MDILFLASNRLEFTRASFHALRMSGIEHARLVVYVDSDVQGTAGILRPFLREQDVLRETQLGSPVAVTNHFLDHDPSTIFAKIDNDLIVYPGWIPACQAVLNANPTLGLLGIEPLQSGVARTGHTVTLAAHIGGVGFMRRHIFENRPRPVPAGRFGFTGWQYSCPEVAKGWMTPNLPVFLLDHLPIEPWLTYSAEYQAKGWQRYVWGNYGAERHDLWDWWDGNPG